MKNRVTLLLMAVLVATFGLCAADRDVKEAQALAQRLSPSLLKKVEFKKITPSATGADVFVLSDKGKKVLIEGSNANAMAVGLNRYLNRYCHTTVSWYADVLVDLPAVLPGVGTKERVESRVPQRFFLNYCTYGYTMPFWDWNDWERFIDWMALNGVNMPLAITGQEAVWYNVWTSLGMSDEETRAYFTGPAYLPWHRMANIDAWCGPLPKEWLDGQVRLQKQILARERALNMRPVLPAFAGHVPAKIRTMFPNADIKPLSTWDEFEEPYRTFFLNSEDPLYARIQKLFLEEQTRMFGTDHIYGIDPFNEMDPPSFEPDYLNKVSKHIYESLTAVDPDAEWLQMAWFLYYQRRDYTPERARAMLTGVPQGKMTLLDYFCERKEMWRDLDGFFGQPYIWCYLGNFGGNTNVQGNVKESGEKLEAALREAGKNLVGVGSTLEGLDVQQFPYEYIFEKAWTFGKSDDEVINELADRHAGVASTPVRQAWKVLYDSVLTFTPTTFCSPVPCSKPMLGKEHKRTAIRYNRAALLEAWDLMLKQDRCSTDALTIDYVWIGRQLLGDIFLTEKQAMDKAYEQGDAEGIKAHYAVMKSLITDIDLLCQAQPFATAQKWIEQARDLGVAPDVKDYYEMNARRLITTWGGDLNDYACRNWAGLLSNYYAARWEVYYNALLGAALNKQKVDEENLNKQIQAVQDQWPLKRDTLRLTASKPDVLTLSRQLRAKYNTQFEAFVK